MDENRESDPFGTLISIITLREHEIGKLRKRIIELKNRLTNIKLQIEEEKRRELDLLNEASDNLKKESELRSRIASLNASIELADKLKNEHMRRIEKEKLELDEMKRRHNAILTEKRKLWAEYELVYESLNGAKEVKKEKSVLKLLNFKLMLKKAELQQFVRDCALLEKIQENIFTSLCSKIDDANRESTELVSEIEAQEKMNRLKREEIEKLKNELGKLKTQHLPFNLMSRVKDNIAYCSRVSSERESLEQPIAKKMCVENINQPEDSNNNSHSPISSSSQAISGFRRALTNPFQQMKNFSSLFSFASLENITSVRPRKRIEEVDEATKNLMLQLEESKKAIIEKRQTELSQLSNESHASLNKFHSNRELNKNWEEVSSNMSQEKQAEKRSNVYSQASSQKNNLEVDAQMELMPPPALGAPQMNDTTNFSQVQSDYGYHSQTQSTFVESQDYRQYAHTMYPSQASGVDYRRDNRPPQMNLPTEENNNRFQFKVEPEPMQQSQQDQPIEQTHNAEQKSTQEHSKENQLNFPSPLCHEGAIAQKNNTDCNNTAASNHQTLSPVEQQMVGSTYDNEEGNYVVESEYFSSKRTYLGEMNTLNRSSLQNMNSFERMDIEMQNEDRAQSPDMSFMMSPICSPMPDGLISPPPPPFADATNMGGFGFQMNSTGNNNVGFAFDSNKPTNSSGGAIFKMF